MGVISIPPGLRLSTTCFLLSIPLAALETVIASRAPWWKLPTERMALWSMAVALLTLPQSAWMARGRIWGHKLAVAFAMVWLLLTIWFAVRTRNTSLGFFALFLGVFLAGVLSWIRREMTRSYFDPAMKWYQGLPSPIPGLSCELNRGDHAETFKVSRLDRDGAFLFHRGSPRDLPDWRNGVVLLRFRFRDREMSCEARPVRLLERDQGVGGGFRFKDPSWDARKKIGDFVELLRGEGYVS